MWGRSCCVRVFCELSFVFGVVDNFVLYSSICASKSVLFNDVKKTPKNSAKCMRATLACLFTCVYSTCVIDIFQ